MKAGVIVVNKSVAEAHVRHPRMTSDYHTHLSKVPRLARIRETAQHPNTRKTHAEHAVTESTGAVRASTICLPLMCCLLLLLGESSGSVGAHLCSHLHALSIDGCVDTERRGRIQCVGRECGRRVGLERLRDGCMGTISIIGECVTVRSVGGGIGRSGKTIGRGRTIERSRGPASFFGVWATDGIHRPLVKHDRWI